MVESRKPASSTRNAAKVDNYEDFIGRLDAASGKLMVRRNGLDKTVEILTLLFRQNTTAFSSWRIGSAGARTSWRTSESLGGKLP
jgi:hypothetical protein